MHAADTLKSSQHVAKMALWKQNLEKNIHYNLSLSKSKIAEMYSSTMLMK